MKQKSGKRYAMQAIVSMCIVMICWKGISWSTMSLYASEVIDTLHCTRSQFQTCFTLNSMCCSLLSIFCYGKLEEKYGLRKLMLFAGIFVTAALVIMASATNIYMIWLGAAMCGAGGCVVGNNTVNVVSAQWFRKNVARYSAIAQASGSLAGIISCSLWGYMILNIGWRFGFMTTAAISVVSTIAVFQLYRGTPDQLGVFPMYAGETQELSSDRKSDRKQNRSIVIKEKREGISFENMLKTRQFYFLAAGYLLTGVAGFAIHSNLALIVTDMGYEDLSGSILGFSFLAQAASYSIGGWIADKFSSKWSVTLGAFAVIITSLILFSGKLPLILIYVCTLLSGFSTGSGQISMGAAIGTILGIRDFGRKMGLIGAFNFCGIALAPLTLSVFYDSMGTYRIGYLFVMAIAVMSAVSMFFAGKPIQNSH